MEYTVQKLSRLSGVTTRTLRYYDELGLLKPARINSSGYRIYGKEEVALLQQILFFRELGFPLETIRDILTAPGFSASVALCSHRAKLLEKRNQLDTLITNVEKTIALTEGRIAMTDTEKFEGFKQKLVEENEMHYGKEVREKYGDHMVEAYNKKLLNKTQQEHESFTALTDELMITLAQAVDTGDPGSDLAQKAAALHKEWLMYHWSDYSSEAHAGLAQMYVADERFKAHYDAIKPGAAEFLRNAILIYTQLTK